MTEHTCQGQVFGHYRMVSCGKKAGHEHEGRWFCKTHHPPTIEEKRAAKTAKWNAEWDAKMAREKKAKEDKAEMERKAAMFDELLKAINSLRSAAYWIVEGGEFAHWVNDKTMPLAAAKELAELAEMVQAAQAITDKATTGETK